MHIFGKKKIQMSERGSLNYTTWFVWNFTVYTESSEKLRESYIFKYETPVKFLLCCAVSILIEYQKILAPIEAEVEVKK